MRMARADESDTELRRRRDDCPNQSQSRAGASHWGFLVVVLLVTVFPFYWIVRTALSNNFAMSADPSSLLPVDFTWGPFKRALGLATPAEAQAEGGSGATLDVRWLAELH